MSVDLQQDRALRASRYPIDDLVEAVTQDGYSRIVGARGGFLPVVIADLVKRLARPTMVVVPDASESRVFFDALSSGTTLGSDNVSFLPPPEISPYAGVSPDRQTTLARVTALTKVPKLGKGEVMVTSALGWSRRSAPAAALAACTVSLSIDDEDVDTAALSATLVAGGYSGVGLVEDPGTFSVRGDIVDIFPAGAEYPFRVELYGDMVESIKRFDPETQRGIDDAAEVTAGPAVETLLTPESLASLRVRLGDLAESLHVPSSRVGAVLRDLRSGVRFFGIESLLPGFHDSLETVAQRLPDDALVIVLEPGECEAQVSKWLEARYDEHEREVGHGELHFAIDQWMIPEAEFGASLSPTGAARVDASSLLQAGEEGIHFPSLDNADLVRVRKQRAGGDGAVHAMLDVLEEWRELYGRIVFTCGSRATVDRVAALIRTYGVEAKVRSKLPSLDTPVSPPCTEYEVALGDLRDGFRSPALGVAVISDRELLGRAARRSGRAAAQEVQTLTSFKELQPNDLIVHIDFGVGRYVGLERMDVGGVGNDFLALQYAGGDKLYLPVYRLDRVQKYAGSNAFQRLDKLGGTAWERTKEKVKKQLADIAEELLRLQAVRAAEEGFRYSEPDEFYAEFEAAFPYEETPHQASAIADVLNDMISDKPMDRLLCGDVGFGKTEVAIRAAYKAVLDGKQVAVLVPTTVLAEQHGKSFQARLRHTAANVAVLSRFRSSAEAKKIVEQVGNGKIDVVIGTHRLLSKDMKFKDLGVLVVDEEQRFGVTHKEKIKKLKSSIDVLTLSATPIPRTLEMAMLGIRDLSVILTPPPGRLAVRTHIAKFQDNVLKDAIDHELQRGGQAFFVHNRVETIHAVATELKRIAPKARVAVGHAQMKDSELEKIMLQFLNRDIDILVSTTIIESGIDIASANTMFINHADKFGLSQLHQLRGRIGRSNQRAYCYLLVKEPKRLSVDGKRRLEVLQQHTELGAGIQIAQHDLDMRGAGNLLGRGQSGHIEAVGFELYSELLNEAVQELRGIAKEETVEPDVKIPVAAYLPEDYVKDVSQRLLFYKRYSMAQNEEELFDVHGELQERYGRAPQPVDSLRDIVRLKLEMKAIGAKKLEAGPNGVVIELSQNTPLDPDKVIELIQSSKGEYEFRPQMTLVRRLKGVQGTDIVAAALRVSREVSSCA